MDDPFAALLIDLQAVFHLEAMRNEKYTNTAIQQLKEATDQYDPKVRNTFINLLKAIRESLPNLEKWRVNFNSIRKNMDELAKNQGMPTIDWSKILEHPKVSPKFQFRAMNERAEIELIPWINSKSDKPFAQLNPFEMTQALLELKNYHGFSQKLSAHLKKDPEFLFNLIMDSERNFIKILDSRLSLYLTDPQIAHAIMKHAAKFVTADDNPMKQVEHFIHKLNEILSKGRSVTTLLRNTEAKTILNGSNLFQIYQSDEYKNRHEAQPSSHPKREG